MASLSATNAPTSPSVALAGRTRVTAVLTTSAATTCAIVLQWSADGIIWTPLATVAASTAAITRKSSIPTGNAAPDFVVPVAARFLRATVDPTTVAAQAFELIIEATFFDPANVPTDKAMLTSDLQSYQQLAMLADRAEGDVLEELLVRVNGALADYTVGYGRSFSYDTYRSATDLFASRGRTALGESVLPDIIGARDPGQLEQLHDQAREPLFDLDLSQSGSGDALRREIVTQVEHLFRRELLARSNEASAQKTLREMTILAPGLCSRLMKRRESSAQTWRGR